MRVPPYSAETPPPSQFGRGRALDGIRCHCSGSPLLAGRYGRGHAREKTGHVRVVARCAAGERSALEPQLTDRPRRSRLAYRFVEVRPLP
jgi:hypothetical protein